MASFGTSLYPHNLIEEKYSWNDPISPAMMSFAVFSNNFSRIESSFGRENKPVRIYTKKEDFQNETFQFAADVASNILTFYEGYFGTSMKVPKLDIFLLPETDQSVRLENW